MSAVGVSVGDGVGVVVDVGDGVAVGVGVAIGVAVGVVDGDLAGSLSYTVGTVSTGASDSGKTGSRSRRAVGSVVALRWTATVTRSPSLVATVVYVELHPLHLSAAECRAIVDRFRDHGFGVVSLVVHETAAGLSDRKSWHGKRLGAEGIDDVERTLLETGHAIELIVTK